MPKNSTIHYWTSFPEIGPEIGLAPENCQEKLIFGANSPVFIQILAFLAPETTFKLEFPHHKILIVSILFDTFYKNVE